MLSAKEPPSTPPRRNTSTFPNHVSPAADDTPLNRFTTSPTPSTKPIRKQPRERSARTKTLRGEILTTEDGTEIRLLKTRKTKDLGRARSSDRTGPGNSPRTATKEEKTRLRPGQADSSELPGADEKGKKTPGKKTLKKKVQ